MSTKILEIINQEFDRAMSQVDPTHPGNEITAKILTQLEQKLTERIEKELIEVQSCEKCESTPAQDTFWVQIDRNQEPVKQSLCLPCSMSLAMEGASLEIYKPKLDHCRFCGQVRSKCHGGGFDDGIQAHDFTPGGIPA